MKKLCFIVIGIVAGAFIHCRVAAVRDRDYLVKAIEEDRLKVAELEGKINAAKKRQEDHEKEALAVVKSITEEMAKVRFSVKAIANSLKFVEKK